MLVDRKKFITLTISIAAAGCAATTDAADEEQVEGEAQAAKTCIKDNALFHTASCYALSLTKLNEPPEPEPGGSRQGWIRQNCEDLARFMKPGPERAARHCMLDIKSRRGVVEISDFYFCARQATEQACSDPSADLFCKPIVEKAKERGAPTTMADCRQLLSSLNVTGRGKALSCVVHDQPFVGLFSCVEGLL